MDSAQVVTLARNALEMTLWLGGPILVVATVVSLLISVGQVLTSLQDSTISTIPKLAAVATAAMLLLPWMLHKLMSYTIGLWSDFHPILR